MYTDHNRYRQCRVHKSAGRFRHVASVARPTARGEVFLPANVALRHETRHCIMDCWWSDSSIAPAAHDAISMLLSSDNDSESSLSPMQTACNERDPSIPAEQATFAQCPTGGIARPISMLFQPTDTTGKLQAAPIHAAEVPMGATCRLCCYQAHAHTLHTAGMDDFAFLQTHDEHPAYVLCPGEEMPRAASVCFESHVCAEQPWMNRFLPISLLQRSAQLVVARHAVCLLCAHKAMDHTPFSAPFLEAHGMDMHCYEEALS